MSDGAVVNVVAMLTGNASGMVSSFGAGSEAAKKFKDTYEKTTAAVGTGSKAMAEAAAKQAEAAQAAADKSVAAIEKTRIAAQTAAAEAQVSADKTIAARTKAAAAAQTAAELQAKAAQTGAAADVEAANIAVTAAERAANAATLAAGKQEAAFKKAGDAALAEAAAVEESAKLQEAAQAKATAAAEAASKKRNSADMAAGAGATKMALASVAALTVVAGASVEMAGKFEKSTELLVTAGGETQANLNMVRNGILNVAQATGISAEQLSEGMYTVEKATFRGAQGLDVLKAAAEGAAAENVDMGTMTNALTSIMMSYHLASDKAVATTNELVAGAGAAKTTMQEYASSLSTVLPVASAAGISFEQVGGAIATLTQHGTSAAESTQELANTIRSLQAPNNVAVSAMQQLGINAQDVAANLGTRGLTGTIQLVTDAISSHLGPEGLVMVDVMKKSATGAADLHTMMNQMSPALRSAAQGFLDGHVSAKQFATEIKGLGAEGDAQGKQFMSLAVTVAGYNDQIKHGGPAAQTAAAALKAIMGGATGMNTALMLGGENMKTFTEKTEEMAAAAQKSGTDISTNEQTQATLAATTARLKQQFEALMITLGTMLIPVVKKLMDGIMGVVTWMKENKGAAEALGAGILTIVAAMTAWAIVSKVIEMGWIGLIVIAIAALVAGFVWAYNNVGWFKDGVDAAMKWIGEAFRNTIDFITKKAIPWLVDAWNNTVKFITNTVGMFRDFFTNTYGMFHDFVKNTVGMLDDFTNNTRGMFKDFFKNTVGMFVDFFKNTVGMFKDFVKNSVGMVEDFDKNTRGMLKDFFKHTSGMFTDFFKNVGDGWKGFWKDPIGEIDNFDKAISDGFKNWIKDTWKNVSQWDMDNRKLFKDWANDTGKNIDDWTHKTSGDIRKWDEDNRASIKRWREDTWANISKWDETTRASISKWREDTWRDISKWDEDTRSAIHAWAMNVPKYIDDFTNNTRGMLQDWWKNTTDGFTGWRKDNTKATDDFSKTSVKNIDDFDNSTRGMLKDWAKNTVGMVVDWGDGIRGAFEDWKKGTTGKTREWVDQTTGMFHDFRANTEGMFRDLFNNVGNWWDGMWNNFQNAAVVPVNFVIETIINHGIIDTFNNAAKMVGLDTNFGHLATISGTDNSGGGRGRAFATGGIMPGYSPGVDNHVIAVGGGEAIMRPEWTRAVGAENVHAMNAMARGGNMAGIRGMMGFADGGIVGDLMGMITGPVNGLMSQIGGGMLGQAMGKIPVAMIDGLTKMAQNALGSMTKPSTGDSGSAASAGVQQWAGLVSQALSMLGQPASLLGTTLRRMDQESGGNARAINDWDSNALAGIPSKGLMQVIDPTFAANAMPGYNTDIYDPLSNILASMRYAIGRYGSLAGAYDQPGGYAMGGIAPVFDNGGWVPPGKSIIDNRTGAPEKLSNTTNSTGFDGATIVLDIPELGGRLEAKIKSVIAGTHSNLTRSLRNSAGIPQGGY